MPDVLVKAFHVCVSPVKDDRERVEHVVFQEQLYLPFHKLGVEDRMVPELDEFLSEPVLEAEWRLFPPLFVFDKRSRLGVTFRNRVFSDFSGDLAGRAGVPDTLAFERARETRGIADQHHTVRK